MPLYCCEDCGWAFTDLRPDAPQARSGECPVCAGTTRPGGRFVPRAPGRRQLARRTPNGEAAVDPALSAGQGCEGELELGDVPYFQLTAERENARIEMAVSVTAHSATTARLSHASAVTSCIPQMSCRPLPPGSMSP